MEDTLFTKESLKEAISTIGDASFTLIYDANELESQLSAGRELQQAEWILATIADHVYDYYPVSYFMNEDGKKEYPEFREWFLSHTEVGVKNAIRFVSNNFSVLETVTRDEYNQHRIPRRDLDKENHVKAVLEEVARNINYLSCVIFIFMDNLYLLELINETRQRGGLLVEPRIVLHGAGAQGVQAVVHAVVPLGEAREVADDVHLGE